MQALFVAAVMVGLRAHLHYGSGHRTRAFGISPKTVHNYVRAMRCEREGLLLAA